jgi:hypothetical protein
MIVSGHSKWSTIKHKKAALDARRGKAWSKHARAITMTAKMGGGNAYADRRHAQNAADSSALAGALARIKGEAWLNRVLQVAARNVDRDPESITGGDRVAPLPDAATGLDQHPASELDDLAGFFGGGNEGARHDKALFRMIPAHERLDTEELAAFEVDDRLVLDEEFVAFQRPVDVLLEAQALPQLFLHSVEHDEAGLPAASCCTS